MTTKMAQDVNNADAPRRPTAAGSTSRRATHADRKWAEAEAWCEDNGIEDVGAYVMGECGLTPDGSCMMAGTEHCDWDCPMRA